MTRTPPPSSKNDMTTAAIDIDVMRTLVCDAQRGSRLAADKLVREHDGWIRGVIYGVSGRPELVDDIAQQVWAQVWERLPSLKEPERLRSWLYAVARNAAIDYGQAQKRRASLALDGVAEAASDERSHNPARTTAGDELHRMMLRAVEALPALYREPFVMRHLEDWSYQEIGETLGLPLETVETRLVRARRLLREMLKGKVDI
jgi:RNA polymerase sigma-70 factor (ECF subfamily)